MIDGFRHLLENLEAARALPFDHPRVIERRHHRESAGVGFRLGALQAIDRRGALENHLGAPALDAGDLDRRRRGRHHDHRRRAKPRRRQRHGLAVIARRDT